MRFGRGPAARIQVGVHWRRIGEKPRTCSKNGAADFGTVGPALPMRPRQRAITRRRASGLVDGETLHQVTEGQRRAASKQRRALAFSCAPLPSTLWRAPPVAPPSAPAPGARAGPACDAGQRALR